MLDAPLVSAKVFNIRKSHGCPLRLGLSARVRPQCETAGKRKSIRCKQRRKRDGCDVVSMRQENGTRCHMRPWMPNVVLEMAQGIRTNRE
jgi:hypothetical protein